MLTILVALTLSLLCGGVVVLTYYNRQQQLLSDTEERLTHQLHSGIQLILSDTIPIEENKEEWLTPFGNLYDSLHIKKRNWGIYQAASVTASSGRFKRNQSFLFAPALPPYMNSCIYLADHDRPLYVTGNTKLTGDAWLSKAGVNAAYINQEGFNNNQLIDGEVKVSEKTLPPLNTMIVRQLYEMSDTSLRAPIISRVTSFSDSDQLRNSFDEEAVLIYSKDSLRLSDCKFEGHILIRSDNCIEVAPTASLQYVILIAPVIKIKRDFKGRLQAIAFDSLVVEDAVELDYPSSLILLKRKGETAQNQMLIGEDCLLKGTFASIFGPEDTYKTFVTIGKRSKVEGVVYTMGYLELAGSVIGTVLTDYFLFKSSGMVYENHLVNVEIDRSRLSPYFLSSLIFYQSTNQQVVAWVP